MLNTKQKKYIAAFLKFGQINIACKEARISKPTYYEWLKIKEFTDELKQQQDCVYNSALNELKNLNTDAVSKYRELLNCKDKSIEFRTASAIIDYTNKLIEGKELKERIEALEQAIEEQTKE